jgi:hypothetical protein
VRFTAEEGVQKIGAQVLVAVEELEELNVTHRQLDAFA